MPKLKKVQGGEGRGELEAMDERGWVLLADEAIERRDFAEVLRCMSKCPSIVHKKEFEDEQSLLFIGIIYGQMEIVRGCLEAGADANQLSRKGEPMLAIAVRRCHGAGSEKESEVFYNMVDLLMCYRACREYVVAGEEQMRDAADARIAKNPRTYAPLLHYFLKT